MTYAYDNASRQSLRLDAKDRTSYVLTWQSLDGPALATGRACASYDAADRHISERRRAGPSSFMRLIN